MLNPYAIAPNLSDGSVWGTVIGYPGAIIRVGPGQGPVRTATTAGDAPPRPGAGPPRPHRGVRAAAAGLRAARRRRRLERRVLGGALERPPRRVRPAQVQRDERPDGDRKTLSRGLDAAPVPRAAAARREGPGQRGD